MCQQAICCGKNLNFLLLNIDSRKVCVTDGGFYHLKPATIHKNICNRFLRKIVLGTDKEMFLFLVSERRVLQESQNGTVSFLCLETYFPGKKRNYGDGQLIPLAVTASTLEEIFICFHLISKCVSCKTTLCQSGKQTHCCCCLFISHNLTSLWFLHFGREPQNCIQSSNLEVP